MSSNKSVNKPEESAKSHVPVTGRDLFFEDPSFRNSWHDFDAVRDAMFAESRDLWKEMDKQFKDVVRCMDHHFMDVDEPLRIGNGTHHSNGESAPAVEAASNKEESKEVAESKTEQNGSSEDSSKSTNGHTALEAQPPNKLSRKEFMNRWDNGWMFPRHWMMPSILPLNEMNLYKHEDTGVIRVHDDDKKFVVSLDTHLYKPNEIKVFTHGRELVVEGRHVDTNEDETETEVRSFKRTYSLPEGSDAKDVSCDLAADGVLVLTVNKDHSSNGDSVKPIEVKTDAEKNCSVH